MHQVIFFGGDSHATYVTKVPDIMSYPLHTIIGSGMTEASAHREKMGMHGGVSNAGASTGVRGALLFAARCSCPKRFIAPSRVHVQQQ